MMNENRHGHGSTKPLRNIWPRPASRSLLRPGTRRRADAMAGRAGVSGLAGHLAVSGGSGGSCGGRTRLRLASAWERPPLQAKMTRLATPGNGWERLGTRLVFSARHFCRVVAGIARFREAVRLLMPTSGSVSAAICPDMPGYARLRLLMAAYGHINIFWNASGLALLG